MSVTTLIRRGILSGLPTGSAGEPLFTTDQFRLYVGSAGGNRLMSVMNKLDATTAPTVNDDAGDGYSVGTRWVDTTNAKTYVLVDSTVGAAVWQQVTGSGSILATEISPSAISAATHNYNPTGLATCSIVNLSATAQVDLTGLAAQTVGSIRTLRNQSGFGILLKTSSGSSLAANRFNFPTDYQLRTNECAVIQYVSGGGYTGWQLIGNSAVGTISSLTFDNLMPLFVTGVSFGSSGAAAITYTLQNTNAKKFLAGPTSGADAPPTFRVIGNTDLQPLTPAGVGHSSGYAPDTGATAHATRPYYLGDDAAWHKLGGGYLGSSIVATDQSTTSTTAVDLGTVDEVTFTIQESTSVLILWVANVYQTTAGFNCSDAIYVDNGSGYAAAGAGIDTGCPGANQGEAAVIAYRYTGFTGSGTKKVKVQHFAPNGGTSHWRSRTLIVLVGE